MVAMVDSAATAPQTVSEQERNDNMILMQLEALRQGRRDHISTRDFKERKAEYVPLRCITRRVDQAGTEENLAAQGKARKQLTAWNTAYLDLQDDGTAEQALKDVNEGKSIILSPLSKF